MKLETFFEKFDQFADAPDALAKMRELVLRMATSGRIAEKDPADQPGSELLEEIFAVRDNLIKRGAAKNRVEGDPITAGDTIDLPPNWARCMISEVCDLQTGATPSRTEHSYFGGDTPWLVSGDINKGEITECDGRITKEGLRNSNCKIIPANSVLIALNGQGKTRATVAVLRIPAALNQSLVAMIPYSDERLLPEYIFWNLRGRYYAIRDITGQDQRRGLNMKLVGQLSIPIPPLAEQKRIVTKVDELMSLCDRLEAQQQERESRHGALARASLARFADAPSPANLPFLFHPSYSLTPAELRGAILRQAFLGRMRWEPRPPKSHLGHLSRLQLEHRKTWEAAQLAAFDLKKAIPKNDAWLKRYVAPDLPQSEELPDIPEHWAWVSLELACPTIIDSPHRTPVYSDSGQYPALRPRDVAAGLLKLNQAARVDTPEYERQTERRKPRCGDIVYSRELSFGWAVILPAEPQICLSQGMVSMQAAGEVDTSFLCKVLNSPIVREQAEAAAIGAAHPHVNLKDIRQFAIPLPLCSANIRSRTS